MQLRMFKCRNVEVSKRVNKTRNLYLRPPYTLSIPATISNAHDDTATANEKVLTLHRITFIHFAEMKIGVFDSGYGGLTVLKDIIEQLPQYDYIYLLRDRKSVV